MKTTTLTFSQAWKLLREIEQGDSILLSDIPEVFRDDYRRFILSFRSANLDDIFGKVSKVEYKHWLNKLHQRQGLDYQIKFKPEGEVIN